MLNKFLRLTRSGVVFLVCTACDKKEYRSIISHTWASSTGKIIYGSSGYIPEQHSTADNTYKCPIILHVQVLACPGPVEDIISKANLSSTSYSYRRPSHSFCSIAWTLVHELKCKQGTEQCWQWWNDPASHQWRTGLTTAHSCSLWQQVVID